MAMMSYEAKYRVRGGTLIGGDLFDFWVGPFYVGFFGVTTIIFASARHAADRLRRGDRPDLGAVQDQHRPAAASATGWAGRRCARAGCGRSSRSARSAPSAPGRCGRWRSRRKLGIGLHVPIAFSAAIFAYATLVVFRPLLLGAWGYGFPYGIMSHLDWVSNVGYQYLHFHYNPAHMLAVTFFFTTTFALALHGGEILAAANPGNGEPLKYGGHESVYFRDTISYSIGELGIHRLG